MLKNTDSTVAVKLLRNELDAHVIAASFQGVSYVSSSGITCSNIRGIEGELFPKESRSAFSKKATAPKQPTATRKKSRKKLVRGSGVRVRKNLLKNRCDAFSRLSDSQRFLAFYTISFPAHFSDESAMKCLNKWLTRVRKWRRKFPYLWVAERQKNGTIHFHLLTNVFLPIKTTNRLMAIAIRNELKDQPNSKVHFNAGKYNGVDVTRVRSPKHVNAYVAKYLTKDLAERINQKWHCSRLFARLSVSLSVHQADIHHIISILHNHQLLESESIIAISNPHFLYIPLKHGPPREYLEGMRINNESNYQQWKEM